MKKQSKKLLKRVFALMLAFIMAVPTVDYSMLITANAENTAAGITVNESGGYEEGAYVEWAPVTGADGYQVYVSKDQNSWELIDDELIRKYEDYFRADALGLTAGTWYVKIDAALFDADKNKIESVAEETITVEVTAHDRSGYAWVNGTASGAYNDDGTLKENADVLYITNNNKDEVVRNVTGAKKNPCVGLQAIFDGYKEGKETKPLDVRIIGNIEDFAVMSKGDIAVENGRNAQASITIEGVGEDAVANGWGIRLDNCLNVEIRNLGFMNCNSTEGDNIGLWNNNEHIWVHHCDFFYGHAGEDGDQKKGDGMLDCKKSDLITFSYNHFWDSGKCCLLGLREGLDDPDFVGRITYHHNWFDHSDSRHPRIRYFTTHIYNNYYDGNAKYGIGAAEGGASIFAENNFFRNCKFPMLISQQGSDLLESDGKFESADKNSSELYENGSIIKAYGNHIEGAKTKRFVAYEAPASQTASEQVETVGFEAYVDKGEDDSMPVLKTDDSTIDANDSDENADEVSSTDNSDKNVDEISSTDDLSEKADETAGTDNTSNTEDSTIDDGAADRNDNVNTDDAAEAETDTPVDENEAESNETLSDESISDTETSEELLEYEEPVSYAQSSNFSDDPSTDFDAYVAASRDEKVPETVKTRKGGFTYNNFDTEPDFYSYKVDEAEAVPEIVKSHAGRVNGGDLQFTFTNEKDDTSSDINEELKSLCTNYAATLKEVGGIYGVTTTVYRTVTFDPGNGDEAYDEKVEVNTAINEPAAPTNIPEGKVAFDGWYNGSRKWDFTTAVTQNMTLVGRWLAEGETPGGYGRQPIGTETVIHHFNVSGTDSLYFDIVGELDTQRGTSGTYNGVNYSSGSGGKGRLNLGNSDSMVTFATTTPSAVVLFLRPDKSGKKTKIDGADYVQTNGILVVSLAAGEHTISKRESDYLYAVMVVPFDSTKQFTVTVDKADGSTATDLMINEGSSVTSSQLANPVRDGYSFGGWKNGDNESITLPYMPLKNVTLKAVWNVTVTFNTDGGSAVASQTIEEGAKCTEPTVPTKDGCTFGGWYKDAECSEGMKYDFDEPVSANLTLYAKWTDNSTPQPPVTVTFTQEPALTSNNGNLETLHPGDVLTVSYSLGADNDAKDASVIKWYRVPDDGEPVEIKSAAGGKEYTITEDDKGYAIKAEVTPKTTDADAGTAKETAVTGVVTQTGSTDIDKGLKIKIVEAGPYTYTGSAIKPAIVVTNYGKTLIEGTDYSVKYSKNINASSDATITVTGKGVFAGKTSEKFTIEKKSITPEVDADGNITDDNGIKAGRIVVVKEKRVSAPVVYYGGLKLKAGKDFTYKKDTTFNGEKTNEILTITGANNYSGTRDIEVLVVNDNNALKAATNKFSVTVNKTEAAKLIYTGESLESQIEACIEVADKADKTKKLKPEDDKYVIAFPANVTDAGTVKFTVVGLDEYSGCNVTASCKILPRTISGAKETADGETGVSTAVNEVLIDYGANKDKKLDYTGSGASFDDLEITWSNGSDKENELTEGKDYKLSYSGNKKTGSTAKYTITFKGNYKGKYVKTFTIDKAELSADTIDEENGIVIADKVCADKNGVYKSTPYINIDGVRVKASEYEVTYYIDEARQTKMDKTHPLAVKGETDATVYVEVKAKSNSKNYTTPADKPIVGSYKVWVKNANKVDLSKAKVLFYKDTADTKNVTKLEYTGEAVEPGRIKVMVSGKEIAADNYTYKIINNTNKGKATVLVFAKDGGTCIGCRTAAYSIVSHKLSISDWFNGR